MKRRNFIISGALTGAAITTQGMASGADSDQKYLEWITFELPTGNGKNLVEELYADVVISALNKNGVPVVGVFKPMFGEHNHKIHYLLQHDSLESAVNWRQEIFMSTSFQESAKKYLSRTVDNPPYERFSTTLMKAFSEMPVVEKPISTDNNDRVFEFRTYQSHNIPYALKKIHMFNEGGELAIFRKTGLNPVFFGETLFGQNMPNLTYMLAFENMQARADAWAKFVAHPDWKKLSNDPAYADTVTRIYDNIYQPGKGSQI